MAIAASLLAMLAVSQADAVQNSSAVPICDGSKGYAASFGGRQTYLWRPHWLEAIANDKDARAKALASGEKSLSSPIYSVTDKSRTIPNASLHDYISIGPYWWPDPNSKDGLPYIRRDGEFNPERNGDNFDKARIRSLGNDAKALSVAYYISGDERFAKHAAKQLRAWFITPETRMNPNFNFAQGIPGRVNGRPFGIIESSSLSTIVEALGLLRTSDALSEEEHRAIRKWYSDFTRWLATSKLGKEEMSKQNNHGIFYDFYLSHFALYTGSVGVSEKLATRFLEQRIAVQMDKKGRFPKELDRTRSWHYSHYLMSGALQLATISECVNVNLWTDTLPKGRSMGTAIAFLSQYWSGEKKWPYKDIGFAKSAEKPLYSKTVKAVQKMTMDKIYQPSNQDGNHLILP